MCQPLFVDPQSALDGLGARFRWSDMDVNLLFHRFHDIPLYNFIKAVLAFDVHSN